MRYVDRGDPAAADFSDATLTLDGTWRDLDLSGIVPSAGASHLVHLFVVVVNYAIPTPFVIGFREKGNVHDYNIARMCAPGSAQYTVSDLWVMMDANRVIQYEGTFDFDHIYITVRGWMEPC